ncbi:hypothetical protein E2562_020091 [Oryza meyeriana var. granulata]|uniref:Uncharacterized protein n=1 Tax=Oryza meyeriana var. granulata TaxID=110450 RepID=A0A6G1EAN2_9ORYZ|nr:hypothetical protein E2562_020091 [Oryza meyeriana var. granulata]
MSCPVFSIPNVHNNRPAMGAAASTLVFACPLALGTSSLGFAFALGVAFAAAVVSSPSPSDVHGKAARGAPADADVPVSSPRIVDDCLVTSYNKLVGVCTDVMDHVRGLFRAAASAAATAFEAVKNAAARVWECLKNAAVTVKRICVELARTACGGEVAVQTARYIDEVSLCDGRAAGAAYGGINLSKASALVARSVEETTGASSGSEPASAAAARRATDMIRLLESVPLVEGVKIPPEVMAAIGVLAVGSALCLSAEFDGDDAEEDDQQLSVHDTSPTIQATRSSLSPCMQATAVLEKDKGKNAL